ncbi:hypothetical protein ES708_26124 [subsurface metagenome]
MLVLSIAGFVGVRNLSMNGRHVVVEVNGHRILELSLDRNVTTSVKGPLGETGIIVENGTARISTSPCPNKYCIRMGRLKHGGEIAVCVPNHVVLYIRGGSEKDSFDGVTQ